MPKQQLNKSSPQKTFQQLLPPETLKLNPFSNVVGHKMMQLENKSRFFEGQLDSLLSENATLKQSYAQIQRQLKNSTQMLRNLLPVPSSPERKLVLQLANIEGVSELIKQDWEEMKKQICICHQQIEDRNNRIRSLEGIHRETLLQHAEQIRKLWQDHEEKIKKIEIDNQRIINGLNSKIKELHQQGQELKSLLNARIKQVTQMEKKFKTQEQEMRDRLRNCDATIARLGEQINSNLKQHEENKKMIVQHYQQLAAEKERQIKESYQFVLKAREEEATKNMKELISLTEELQTKIRTKEEQIFQLYELNNRYITQKEGLNEQKASLKRELSNARDQIDKISMDLNAKEDKIQGLNLDIKQLNREVSQKVKQISILNSNIQNMSTQLKQTHEFYLNELKQKDNLIAEKERQNKKIQDKFRNNINDKQEKIKMYQNIIHQKQKQLQKAMKYEQNCFQLLKTVQLYKQKVLQHENTTAQHQKKLLQMEQGMETLKKQNLIRNQQLQEKMRAKAEQLIRQHKERIKIMQQQHQSYLEIIRAQQKRREIQTQQLIRSAQLQFKKRIDGLQHSLQLVNQQNVKNSQQYSALQQKYNDQIQKMQREHSEAMKNAQQNFHNQLQQIQFIAAQKIKSYEKQLLEKQKEFRSLLFNKEKEYEREMDIRKQEYHKKMNSLEKDLQKLKANNGILEFQTKYNNMMEKLKLESDKQKDKIRRQKEKQLQSLKIAFEKTLKDRQNILELELNQQKLKYQSQIKQIQAKYNEQLSQISSKLHSNIVTLNEELVQEKEAHQFTKMTREEKILYLTEKILQIRRNSEEKDIKIIELEYSLEKKIKELQDVDLLVTQKMKRKKEEYEAFVENIKTECERVITKNTFDCKQKVKSIERERIEFSGVLYKDFNQIKEKYERELASTHRKYDQLQKLFQQRPSREEDVTKIKELTMIKQKMDLEVKEFQKKMVNANEIVKYLNLQLQNYKDVYDIFGSQAVDLVTAQKKKQQFQTYIRNNIVNLVEPKPDTKRENQQNPKIKLTSIRQILKQRNRRFKTQGQISKQEGSSSAVLKESKHSTMHKVQQQQEEEQRVDIERNHSDNKMMQEKIRMYRKRKMDEGKLLQRYGSGDGLTQIKQQQKKKQQRTTKQLRNNAEIFLSLINSSQKSAVEIKNKHALYSRRSIKRRTQSTLQKINKQKDRQKKYKLKDRIVTIQN